MRTLLLSTAAALVLAAPAPVAWAQTSPGAIVIEGTETAPADLVGQTVHATYADRSDVAEIDSVPPDWLPVGVIEALSEGGDVAVVAFEQGTMVPDQLSRAEVGVERLRLVPASGEPQGYAVLFDAEGTPLAGRLEGLERDRLAAIAQSDSPLFAQGEPAPVAQAAGTAEALTDEDVTVEGATEGMPVTAAEGTTVQETTTGAASSPTAGDSGLVAGTPQPGTDAAPQATGPAAGLEAAGAAAVGDTPLEQAAAADASGELEPGAGSATGIEPVEEAGAGAQDAQETAEPPTVTGTGTLLGTTPSPEEAQGAATGAEAAMAPAATAADATATDPATTGAATVVTTDPAGIQGQAETAAPADTAADPQAGAAEETTDATTEAAPATTTVTTDPQPDTAAQPDAQTGAATGAATTTGTAQEGLREEPIADPSLPPIENAETVVPEGTLTDQAPLQAETGLASPTQTAPTPLLPTDQAIAETSAPAGATAMMRPDYAPEGFEPVDMATLDPAELLQVSVYSADDEAIGTIDRWVGEQQEGMLPEGAVVDVGGFLGVGSRRIAIASELMTLMTEAGTNDRRVYVDLTRAQIDAIPASAD